MTRLNGLERFYCRGRVVAKIVSYGSGLRLVADVVDGTKLVIHVSELTLRPRGLPDPKSITEKGA